MPEPNEALLVDFLSWLAGGERPYGDVMEAWRTSCPRLTVWEDALEAGWIERRRGAFVALSDQGRTWLAKRQVRAA